MRLLLVLLAFAAVSHAETADRIAVYKQQRKLVLYSHGKEIKSYRVALGSEPVGAKARQGDHRTPEGSYVLDRKNDQSRFYKAFHISYPNPQQLADAHHLGIDPGGDIMLHGMRKHYGWIGKLHTLHDWTDGCIAVTNDEMDELWRIVPVGTPIDIYP
jgi:murein L,D-transpeptidase YafK